MTERAVITGVTGFVGRHLCQHLQECGDEVLGITNRQEQEAPHWGRLPDSDRLLVWDITDPSGPPPEVYQGVVRFRPTVIYHLAAVSLPELCGQGKPTEFAWAVNVEGTRQVVRLACQLPEPPRLVFTSTSHLYQVPQDSITFVDETYPVKPRNAYAQTKLAAEQVLLEAYYDRGLPVIIVRAFPHTGAGQSEKMMLPAWVAQLVRGQSPVKIHTLQAVIDLTDVRDVVRAYRLLAKQGKAGEVYLVGSGIPRTSGEVFNILREIAARDEMVLETRPGMKYDPIAVIEKIRQATGWSPCIPLETTVRDVYEWWLTQAYRERTAQNEQNPKAPQQNAHLA